MKLPLECSIPYYIDKAKVSRLLIANLVNGLKNYIDIGFNPEVPVMTPFEETPFGIHLGEELALKEFKLCALQEKMNTGMLNNDACIPVDLSILEKPSITYSSIDIDDIFANFLQDLHREPLENKLQCLIDDNSLDIEFVNLNTNVQGQDWYDTSRDELEEEDILHEFSVAKEEYYEVFPNEGSQGNAPIYLYKSLKLLLQQYEKACTQ